MKKDIFTLIELLIVIVIISILLLISLNFLSTQLEKNLFQLQIQKTISFFTQTSIQNMSKSSIGNKIYNQISIELISNTNKLNKYLLSGTNKKLINTLIYKNAYISGIKINGIDVFTGKIIFNLYQHNSIFKTLTNQYTSGNIMFFIYSKNNQFKKCLKFILDTSKITKC